MGDEAELEKEKKAMEDKFAKEFKTLADKKIAAKAALKAERDENKKHAQAAMKAIKKRFAAKKAAQKKAESAWQKKADADAKALKASRSATQEKFKKQAAKADEEY